MRLFKRKCATRELGSAKTREKWSDTQDLHLIPAFGDFYVDAIRRADVADWLTRQARRVPDEYSPRTVNSWLAVLLATLRAALVELDLEYDPTRGIKPLDTSTHHTYTEEEPGSLIPAEVPRFLHEARRLYPQHYAMLVLGLATGRRPSELRPLRRTGDKPDVLWDQGILLVRRSETMGEVMERTKTGRSLRVHLPPALLQILEEHAASLPEGPMQKSELLFPSTTGGYRAGSCLDKPIREIAAAAGIRKKLTARFMRRTFQDLCRAAGVHDLTTRAISGHATVEMQAHYSTVDGHEVRASLARVATLAGLRAGGDRGGDEGAENDQGAVGSTDNPSSLLVGDAGFEPATSTV